MIRMLPIGDWRQAFATTGALAVTMRQVAEAVMQHIAEKGVEIVKSHIMEQDLEWAELSEAWQKQKARQGMFSEIYLATGRFYDAVEYWRVGDEFVVGIRPGATDARGRDLVMVAKVLEYGISGIDFPARPLWEPSREETIQYGKSNVKLESFFRVV